MGKRGARLNKEPWTPREEQPEDIIPAKKTDILEEVLTNQRLQNSSGAWIKFIARSTERLDNNINFFAARRKSDRNRIYFNIKPSGIKDNEVLYITALSYDDKNRPSPMIIGRTVTYGYNERNIVTEQEIAADYSRKDYPYYLEFKEGRFINTPIKTTLPLHLLYDSIGTKTYPSLVNNSKADRASLNRVHSQKSHLKITEMAKDYLDEKLEEYFNKYGFLDINS